MPSIIINTPFNNLSMRFITTLYLCLFSCMLLGQNAIYLSPFGSDSHSGTCDQPVATLQAAVDKSRQTGIKNILIYGGRYFYDQPVNLDAADAGLTISAVEGEKVIFDGGKTIDPNSFAKVTNNLNGRIKDEVVNKLYVATITDAELQALLNNSVTNISFNDKAISIARFPNKGMTVYRNADIIGNIETVNEEGTHDTPKGWAFKLTDDFSFNHDAWEAEINRHKKAEMSGYHSAVWWKMTTPLATVKHNGDYIRTVNGSRYGITLNNQVKRTYFTNILYELDEPGEWFFDEIDNKFYLYPTTPTLSSNSLITVWAGPECINISNTNHVTIEKITIQNAGKSSTRGDGVIDIHNSNYIKIAGVVFKNSTLASLNIWHDVRNSGVLSCDFIDAGGCRLYGGGHTNNSVTHGNNYFENCHYTKVYQKDNTGKFCGISGAGQVFRNNLCHNTNGQPITFAGVDHLFELNETFNTGVEQGDGGSMYIGNSRWTFGNELRHNFYHHMLTIVGSALGRAGIHMDDGTSGTKVVENVFYRCGYGPKMGSGGGHVIDRNVMIGNNQGIRNYWRDENSQEVKNGYNQMMDYIDNDPTNGIKENSLGRTLQAVGVDGWEVGINRDNWVNRLDPWWINRYPRFGTMVNRLFNNKKDLPYASQFHDNLLTDNDAGIVTHENANEIVSLQNNDEVGINIFKNPSILNFNFNGNAPSDAPSIPFDAIGLYLDEYRCAVPDKASYRKAIKDYFANRKVHGESLDYKTMNDLTYFNSGLSVLSTVPCADVVVATVEKNQYYFDPGTPNSPVWPNTIQLTHKTNELNYGWVNPNNLKSADRGDNAGANNLNRDFIFSDQANTFEAKVENGNWKVLLTFGDTQGNHDNIQVKGEGIIVLPDVDITAGNFFNEEFILNVKDGKLSLTFSDLGGTDPNWFINRIRLTKTDAAADCEENCKGEIMDADDDGICNTNDNCPILDNNLIGQPCNDGDPCTFNDVYTDDCNCRGTADFQPISGLALDIGTGGGETFIVGSNNHVYQWLECENKWNRIADNLLAKRIDVQGDGTPWITATDHKIYKWEGTAFAQQIGAGIDIGINGNHIFIVGTNKQIYNWNGQGWTKKYAANHPNMNRIDATANGYARTIGEDGLHYWDQGNGVFAKGSFTGIDVNVPEGTWETYVLSTSGEIHKYVGGGNYTFIGGINGKNLTISKEGDFWLTKNNNTIERKISCESLLPVDGKTCDDGDACTVNDVYVDCNCVGTYSDGDSDDICDGQDDTEGDCLLGSPCNINNACNAFYVYDRYCNCVEIDIFKNQFYFDAGTNSSPLWERNDAIKLTPSTKTPQYYWMNPKELNSTDHGAGNELNRDYVSSANPNTFETVVANGEWKVLFTFFDVENRDDIRVKAEGQIMLDNIDITAYNGFNKEFRVNVQDNRLTLELSDEGGTDNHWSFARMVLTKVEPTEEYETMSGLGIDIGTGGGETFLIGTNNHSYQYDACNNQWIKIAATPLAKRIDVQGDGTPWITTIDNQIYRWNGNAFVIAPGAAIDIGINGNHVFVIGMNKQIYTWNGQGWTKKYAANHPNLNRIDATVNGTARAIGEDGLFYWDQGNGVFAKGDFIGKDIAVPEGKGGSYVLSNSGEIFTYIGGGVYSLVGANHVENLSISSNGDIWVTKNNNIIQRKAGCESNSPLIGSACDDGDNCTINDVYIDACNCQGTVQDSDNDGICDANDTTNGNCIKGTSCDDGDACTTNDVYDANCNCEGTFQDRDEDGTCDVSDCAPNDSNYPKPAGSLCDDDNPNTINDTVQNDGCTCAGQIINADDGLDTVSCGANLVIISGNGSITMEGGSFYQIFDNNWQTIFNCGWQCGSSKTVDNLASGEYRVFIKDNNYNVICEKVITLSASTGSGDTDTGTSNNSDHTDGDDTDSGSTDNSSTEGTTVTCGDLAITYGEGTVNMVGQAGQSYYFKINDLNNGWAQAFGCGWNCGYEQTATNLPNSRYLITIYNADWSKHCEVEITMSNSHFTQSADSRSAPQLNFEAFNAQRTVDLQWLTNSGYKAEYFEVERSTNGVHFEPLEKSINKEWGKKLAYHQTTDLAPTLGTNYYRVKEVYLDGSFTYTDIKLVDFNIDVDQLSIYPNPVENVLNLNLKPIIGKSTTLNIVNAFGQVVQKNALGIVNQERVQIELDNSIPNGFYQVLIEVEGQKSIAKKLIVKRLY